ncbi:general transcription factor IIF subunit 1-like isoform X2 [Oculina patagonica]
MDKQRTASPVQLTAKPLLQQKVGGMPQASGSGAITGSANGSVFKVRVPRNLAKKYSVMRFQSTKVDFSSISKAQMSRQTDSTEEKESENLPTSGAGSEFGRERREEARKKRRGIVTKPKDPEAAPWNLKIGGKSGRRFTGRKEAGINENSSYYILTQCEDGAFQALPVKNWYNFTANIKYQTLTEEEAEEEFGRRERTVNYFSLMVKKRLTDNKEDSEEGDEKNMLDKTAKAASRTGNLIIHDDERDLSLSEEEEDDDDEEEGQGGDKNKEDKQAKKDKHKVGQRRQQKTKKGSDADSDASSEEDGYMDSKEMDYLSDSSSSSEEDVKTVEESKPKAEDDLNAEETSSEDEDDLTQAGHELKDMLDREEGRESWDEEEDEDPDQDEMKGTSALFLQGDKKKKKKSGSGSSTSSNSRSSTPTTAIDGAANTIAAAASKLTQDRPGTPSKTKKRPASSAKKGTTGEEGSPASKKPRVSPAPSSVGTGGGSRTSTPTPTGNEEGPQGITEEAVRRYLIRKPMTSKDLLQKFKSKRTGLSNDETVKKIAAIVRKLQPEQKTIKGKLYLSLKPLS